MKTRNKTEMEERRPVRRRSTLQAAIFCAWLLTTGCVGPLYKVAPLPSPPSSEMVKATSGSGFEIAATALAEDTAYARFSANLHLAGVIAVEVRLANSTAQPVPLSAARFTLNDASGRTFKQLAPKKALARVMKYYGVRLYGLESYRQTRESYETLALPVSTDLNPGEERRGMLYFEAKPPLADDGTLVLGLAGRGIEVKLPLR